MCSAGPDHWRCRLRSGLTSRSVGDAAVDVGDDGFQQIAERRDLLVVTEQRFTPEIEASAYFVVAEALTNVAKHARARQAHVTASVDDDDLHVAVCDDGVGGAQPNGTGLVGLHDRIVALGGQLEIESPPGHGTRIIATLPVQPPNASSAHEEDGRFTSAGPTRD
jgi:signal transduction histidine kinase